LRLFVYSPALDHEEGLYKSVYHLIEGMKSRGHECKLLIMRHGDQAMSAIPDSMQDAIICGADRQGRFRSEEPVIQAILDLQHTLTQLPAPDVIITLSPLCTGVARAAINSCETSPKIVSRVSGEWSKMDHIEQLVYADAHLAISTGVEEKIKEMAPGARVKTIFIPVSEAQALMIPRAERTTFLYIGKLYNVQKRIDVLFRALSALPNKNWKLKLIEDSRPEPGSSDEIRLKDLSIKLGIADRIEWLGYRESPWDVVDEATALILPSDYESFCGVLLEALIRGIPVISSDCPTGPRDIIQHGHNGWLFRPGDVLALAGMLSRIMSGSLVLPSPEVCRESVKHFTCEKVLDSLEAALYAYLDDQNLKTG